jgi:hypothetical protein
MDLKLKGKSASPPKARPAAVAAVPDAHKAEKNAKSTASGVQGTRRRVGRARDQAGSSKADAAREPSPETAPSSPSAGVLAIPTGQSHAGFFVPEKGSTIEKEVNYYIKGQVALWSLNGELFNGETISRQSVRSIEAFLTHACDEYPTLGLSRKYVRGRLVCNLKSRAAPTEAQLGRILPRKKLLKSGELRFYKFKVTQGGLKRVTVDLTNEDDGDGGDGEADASGGAVEDSKRVKVEEAEVTVKKEPEEEKPFNPSSLEMGNAVAFGFAEQPEMGPKNVYVGYGTVRAGSGFFFFFSRYYFMCNVCDLVLAMCVVWV